METTRKDSVNYTGNSESSKRWEKTSSALNLKKPAKVGYYC